MMHNPLLFDFQSTTPCEKEVIEAMAPYWNEYFGNPSSRNNSLALRAAAAVDLAREKLGDCLRVNSERIVFTSGATEANNLALLGYSRARALENGRPGHLITLSTEHQSVLGPCRQLEREGFAVTELCPDLDGLITTKKLIDAFREDTILVSIMFANNEIGVLQPIKDLSAICHERSIAFHTDAAQAFGNLPISLDKNYIDLFSFSAHKIYGPKGIGALIVGSNSSLLPLQWGGGQEQGIRPGTISVPLVIGFAKAAEIAMKDLDIRQKRISNLRDLLLQGLLKKIPDIIINGSLEKRLSNNLNFTIPNLNGNRFHKELRSLVSCGSGSACSQGNISKVLTSLGRSRKEAAASVRISFGRYTTLSEVNQLINILDRLVSKLSD